MHENCGGELQYRQDLEEKGRVGVFECNKCHCKFGVISIRKEVGCPSLKEYVSKTETKRKQTVWVNVAEGSQPVIKELPLVSGESESQSLSTTNASIKRKRGRPRNASNKVST